MAPAFSLHILPPAFSLPSIDAECLAAVAYFTWALPRSSWTLVGESGLDVGQVLPCLRDTSGGRRGDRAVVVRGFDNIVRHLRDVSRGQWDLDASLDATARADCIAFSSHLIQTLSPLVDLSLYICAENYDGTTRVAYGASLAFPDSWVVPPERQRIAAQRTSHLGIEPEDLASSNPTSRRTSRSLSNSPPARAFDQPAPAASAAAAKSLAAQAVASSRLTALIQAALQPLAALQEASEARQQQRFLLGAAPSTLDCHALALLALALLPSLTNPFLAHGFASFPGLERYTRQTIRECFGPPVTASDALVRAPLQEEDDENDDADDGVVDFDSYANVNVGSGVVQLPWRRGRRSALNVAKGVAKAVLG